MENLNDILNGTEPCVSELDENGRPNDPERWVGNWTYSATDRQAAELCAGCHVLDECLKFALENDEKHFIWGGTTPRQRKELKRAQRQRSNKISNGLIDNPEGAG